MRRISAPPGVSLMESMRSIGYSMEASIADLVDNSVSAGADRVSLLTGTKPEPYIALLDDGFGMDDAALLQAMTLGARSPGQLRDDSDLGRFGLGLKTASLAHCRVLTVLSKQDETVHAARWDLNELEVSRKWDLHWLNQREWARTPEASRLMALKHGTLVVWTDLDQVITSLGNLDEGLDAAIVDIREHLELVFHRYLAGDAPRVYMDVNGLPLEGADPFLEHHKKTMRAPLETIYVDQVPITFQAFTLPIPSSLTEQERDVGRLRNGLRDTQGFYVYRNRRLVVQGSWFNLRTRQEADKLTRVRMDIPNSLDHLWQLDVKKSRAQPPAEVRLRVKHLMDRATKPSREAIKYRGRNLAKDDIQRLWNVVQDRNAIRYEINRQHPAVVTLLASNDARSVEDLLAMLEATAPWEDAYLRYAEDRYVERPTVELGVLAQQAKALLSVVDAKSDDDPIAILRRVEPFSALNDATMNKLVKEISK